MQNDFVIADADGQTVLNDLNGAFQALASKSSGTSEPSTTYAGQSWWDTTNNLLKIRNGANNAWVTIASWDGTTWVPWVNGAGIDADFVDVASATTTDIGAAASRNVRVTGSVTITGLGTADAGTTRHVRFAAALTLTHNGTSLILPGSANITTAANDTATFVSLGAGNWLCANYKKANGEAVVSSNVSAASQAQMEAATSTTVYSSPGRQHFHPGHPKVWANLNGTGTIALRDDYNVSSVTDVNIGDYSFSYTNAMLDTNYAVGPHGSVAISTSVTTNNYQVAAQATGSSQYRNYDNSGTAQDTALFTIDAHGALA